MLNDYLALVPRLVRDNNSGNTLPEDIQRAIRSAVQQYSADAPRKVVADIEWDVTGYTQAPPGELADGYTVLSAERLPATVPPNEVALTNYMTPTGLQLLAEVSIAAGTQLRVMFTAAHELSGDDDTAVDTIPLAHRDAVARYAAHLLCQELATHYSGERESSIGADGSNTESRARNYAARSKDYRAAYFAALGILDPLAAARNGGAAAVSAGGEFVSLGQRNRRWWRTNGGWPA